MAGTVRVALIAIGGYGGQYLRALLDPPADEDVEFVGAVDPVAPKREPGQARALEERGVPLYPDLDAFFAHHDADLVVVASPHHFHCPHALGALAHGASVLVEKPVAATIQDARRMAGAARKAGKFVAVGFQWSFAAGIQALKRHIHEGRFGRPVRFKTLALWPRPESYYRRNNWAGRRRSDDGAWVLDSPINNATAHYLHNMLYLLGPGRERSATPADVAAELYRANAIENFDTAALRCHTAAGVEVLFYSSHAVPARIGPIVCGEFEKAVVCYDRYGAGADARFVARSHGGAIETYDPPGGHDMRKLWECVGAVRTGAPVACDVEAASAHLLCVNGAQDSMRDIVEFPASLVSAQGGGEERQRFVRGLGDALIQCFAQGILPSEHGDLAWAKPGEPVDLTTYRGFPRQRIASS